MSSLPEYEPRALKPAAQPRAPERRKSCKGWIIVGVIVTVVIWGLASVPRSPETPPVETMSLSRFDKPMTRDDIEEIKSIIRNSAPDQPGSRGSGQRSVG